MGNYKLKYFRIRNLRARDLGNYSCSVGMDGGNKELDVASMMVDKLPPPPVFIAKSDRVNESSQLLTWTGMDEITDRKSTRLNSSHSQQSRMPSSA